jgi:hypothetical protein
LRDDFPFNPAAFILAERAFYDEIGASPLTPAFGQHGDYAARFDDGVHDAFYYLPEDFSLLGVPNVHLGEPESNGAAGEGSEVFRARVSAGALRAVNADLDALTRKVEAAMSFSRNEIWVSAD